MDTSGIRVLLVDDDQEEYLLAKRYLANARTGPFSVSWAPTFESALSEIRGGRHDICLLDYQLGERTGMELLREIRASGHDLPVILLTGHGSLELDLAAMQMGAFDYLEKADLSPVLLERSIRYTIADYRARAELRKANEDLERRVQERTAELDRSNRELEQFAQMVASDLAEPLHALVAQIEGLKADAQAKDAEGQPMSVPAVLDCVLHAVRNMELLIQSVLNCARAGRAVRPAEAVDLGEALREACDDLEGTIAESGAEIEAEKLPSVPGDRRLVRGLFRNLVENAIRFRGEQPPKVRFAAERRGDSWLVSVTDNGVGIEPEESEDVFMMLCRGTREQQRAGIGLGLSVCRKIIQYHGGRIWVDGVANHGSTFYLTFPVK